jgi:hypothetical protein
VLVPQINESPTTFSGSARHNVAIVMKTGKVIDTHNHAGQFKEW